MRLPQFTIRDLLWLMVVVAVALAVFFIKPHRVRWEYKAVLSGDPAMNLNAEGDEGWELVDFETGANHSGTVFHFKRPKSN